MIEIDEKRARQAVNAVAKTKDGQIVLFLLMEYCSFNKDIVAVKPEDTHANAALGRAYLHLRNLTEDKHLKKIEFDYRKAKPNERRNTGKRKRDRITGSPKLSNP